VFGQAVLTIELKAAVVVFLEQWVAFYSINRSLQREARINLGASLNQTDSGSLSVDLARECAPPACSVGWWLMAGAGLF
jgi:hypothetical protein